MRAASDEQFRAHSRRPSAAQFDRAGEPITLYALTNLQNLTYTTGLWRLGLPDCPGLHVLLPVFCCFFRRVKTRFVPPDAQCSPYRFKKCRLFLIVPLINIGTTTKIKKWFSGNTEIKSVSPSFNPVLQSPGECGVLTNRDNQQYPFTDKNSPAFRRVGHTCRPGAQVRHGCRPRLFCRLPGHRCNPPA